MNPLEPLPRLEAYAATTAGRRETNQDGHLLLELPRGGQFIAVADGMGGAAEGGTASSLVLESAAHLLTSRFQDAGESLDLKGVILEVFAQAQEAIAEYLEMHPASRGMGTTLVCTLTRGGRFAVGNIGDSRAYLIRGGNAVQLTRDHSYVEEFRQQAGAAMDECILSRYANAITRCVDGGHDLPDVFPEDSDNFVLEPGDALVLCSDGLILEKSSTEAGFIVDHLYGTESVQSAAEKLVAFSYDQGSQDNITVIAASYGQVPREQRRRLETLRYQRVPRQRNRRRRGMGIAIGTATICLAVAAYVALTLPGVTSAIPRFLQSILPGSSRSPGHGQPRPGRGAERLALGDWGFSRGASIADYPNVSVVNWDAPVTARLVDSYSVGILVRTDQRDQRIGRIDGIKASHIRLEEVYTAVRPYLESSRPAANDLTLFLEVSCMIDGLSYASSRPRLTVIYHIR